LSEAADIPGSPTCVYSCPCSRRSKAASRGTAWSKNQADRADLTQAAVVPTAVSSRLAAANASACRRSFTGFPCRSLTLNKVRPGADYGLIRPVLRGHRQGQQKKCSQCSHRDSIAGSGVKMQVDRVEVEIFHHGIFRFHFDFAGGTGDVDVVWFDGQV